MYSCQYLQLDLLEVACECAALPDLTQQVLSLFILGACFLTHKYPELFYPLKIGFWEVVRDTQQLNMSCGQPFESFWSDS